MRKSAALLLVWTCQAATITFNVSSEGSLPPGWTVAMTHTGGAPKWQVVKDGDLHVLAQVSTDTTAGRFPLAIYQRANLREGVVSVRFKPVAGTVDQAAGIVWRYKDPENYYVVRVNALEDNVAMFKVENGVRSALLPKNTASKTYAVDYQVPRLKWSTLQVSFQAGSFIVVVNGRKLFEAEDTTFGAAGKTGLWTKADSVTYFQDFEFTDKVAR